MIHRLTVVLLTIVAVVLGANIVCMAQPQSLLTRHVRDVTLNGQAPFGRSARHSTLHARRCCSGGTRSGRVG